MPAPIPGCLIPPLRSPLGSANPRSPAGLYSPSVVLPGNGGGVGTAYRTGGGDARGASEPPLSLSPVLERSTYLGGRADDGWSPVGVVHARDHPDGYHVPAMGGGLDRGVGGVSVGAGAGGFCWASRGFPPRPRRFTPPLQRDTPGRVGAVHLRGRLERRIWRRPPRTGEPGGSGGGGRAWPSRPRATQCHQGRGTPWRRTPWRGTTGAAGGDERGGGAARRGAWLLRSGVRKGRRRGAAGGAAAAGRRGATWRGNGRGGGAARPGRGCVHFGRLPPPPRSSHTASPQAGGDSGAAGGWRLACPRRGRGCRVPVQQQGVAPARGRHRSRGSDHGRGTRVGGGPSGGAVCPGRDVWREAGTVLVGRVGEPGGVHEGAGRGGARDERGRDTVFTYAPSPHATVSPSPPVRFGAE